MLSLGESLLSRINRDCACGVGVGGVLPSPHTPEMNNQMHTKKHQLIGECVLASDYVGISLSLFGGECGQQDMVW